MAKWNVYFRFKVKIKKFKTSVNIKQTRMAGAYNNSEDDFKSSPPVSQKFVRKNQKIPVGHILASLKWRNTSVVQKMTGIHNFMTVHSPKLIKFHCEPLKTNREHQSFVYFWFGCGGLSPIWRLCSSLHFCSGNDWRCFVQKTTGWTQISEYNIPLFSISEILWIVLFSLGQRNSQGYCGRKNLPLFTAV